MSDNNNAAAPRNLLTTLFSLITGQIARAMTPPSPEELQAQAGMSRPRFCCNQMTGICIALISCLALCIMALIQSNRFPQLMLGVFQNCTLDDMGITKEGEFFCKIDDDRKSL